MVGFLGFITSTEERPVLNVVSVPVNVHFQYCCRQTGSSSNLDSRCDINAVLHAMKGFNFWVQKLDAE
jgi:hypothetical protein